MKNDIAFTFRLSKKTLKTLQVFQEQSGVTVAEQIRRAVDQYIKRESPLGIAELMHELGIDGTRKPAKAKPKAKPKAK